MGQARFKVVDSLYEECLRTLPEGTEVVDAYQSMNQQVMVLTVSHPDLPEGLYECVPILTRYENPVTGEVGVRWDWNV